MTASEIAKQLADDEASLALVPIEEFGQELVDVLSTRLLSGAAGLYSVPAVQEQMLSSINIMARAGNKGDSGDTRQHDVSDRQVAPPIVDGHALLSVVSGPDFAQAFQGPVLDFLVLAIEEEYRRRGDTSDAGLRARIEFLLSICQDDPTADRHKTEILARVFSMAKKAALGLDAFGYSLEEAPLLAFETYAEVIKEVGLPTALTIEKAYVDYMRAVGNAESQKTALQQSLMVVQQHQANLANESARVATDAANLLKSLPGLDAQVQSAYAILLTAESKLTDAIRRKNSGCDLVGTLTAVSTIVAGVASGGAGFIAAAGAGAKLFKDFGAHNDSLKQLWDERAVLKDDLEEIAKGASTVGEAVSKIQEGVGKLTPEQRKVPQFRMEREKFDEVAKEYADLADAGTYREAGYAYLKAVETRNQAIVDYNAMLVRVIELQAAIFSQERIAAGLDSVVNGLNDPAHPVVLGLLARFYGDALSLVGSMIHAERKALAYSFARPARAPVSALNVGALAATHQTAVLVDWVQAKARYQARRELSKDALSIELKELVSPRSWEAFKRGDGRGGHPLQFNIRRDHPKYQPIFDHLPGLRITGLCLTLHGAKVKQGQEQVGWLLFHGGVETLYKQDGSTVHFSHPQISFNGFTSLNGTPPIVDSDFSEKSLYAGLSPFAHWLLLMSDNPLLGLDLKQLTSAKLSIQGYIVEG